MKFIKSGIKSSTKAQMSFIFVFLIGFIFNLVFNIVAYRHLQVSTAAGQLVSHTYEVIVHLQNLNEAIDRHLLNNDKEATAIYQETDYLQKISKNERLQNLLTKLMDNINNKEARSIVSEMLRVASGLLRERTQKEIFEDEKYEVLLSHILLADCFLLLLLLFFFVLEMRSRKVIEWNLNSSLNYIREANYTLQAEALKRQNAMKMTVHDLKNPLGTIQGFADLIASEKTSNTSIHEFSEVIKRISKNSLDLVDSMLVSSDTAVTPMETIDLVPLLSDICAQNRVQAELKKQDLVLDCSLKKAPVYGNAMKLEELLVNLVSNAIKYSPLGGKIWVRCFSTETDCVVEVEDQGAGFNEEDRKKAFHYGETLSARPTGNESSTGIGLYIAKQIADIHHGRLEICDSLSGVGACLRFGIPKNEF